MTSLVSAHRHIDNLTRFHSTLLKEREFIVTYRTHHEESISLIAFSAGEWLDVRWRLICLSARHANVESKRILSLVTLNPAVQVSFATCNVLSTTPIYPGFRVPFFIVSPWTRGGSVFTEPADHISQLLFMEKWAETRGKAFHIEAISDWRREHMSDLVNVFDWDHVSVSVSPLNNE